ncbi:MAG: TauD/TfdA family dioxygenase [Alphaproteobacteria bacterium]|jgi:taurine dioxygenase
MTMEIVRLAPDIGAEIVGLDLSQPLSDGTVGLIRSAWMRHLVLVFRGQRLSDEALVRFSGLFGDLDTVPGWEPFSPEGFPQVLTISNVVEGNRAIGVLGDGEAAWHTDMSYLDLPPTASLLHSHEVPETGGDTLFMNMYAALDTLPDDLRRAVEGRTLNHDSSHDSSGTLRGNHSMFESIDTAPGARHPMIRIHPVTGRPALFLGRRLHAWIVGESVADSDALLDRLWQHCTQGDFVYRHRWAAGDLVMWDNRCTMHRRDPFDPATRRIMHRCQVKGGEPVVAAAAE